MAMATRRQVNVFKLFQTERNPKVFEPVEISVGKETMVMFVLTASLCSGGQIWGKCT